MQAIAPFLAGLGLFFCGVHFISSNLLPMVGGRFRKLLTRIGRHPWLAALFGAIAGVVTQSTNAVTSITIGLVSGGVLDKRRAMIIPTWSHVGVSVLVILVAIDFRLAASYLVALAGAAVYFGVGRSDRARHGIGTLLGLGFLFLGMQMVRTGAEPLRDYLVNSGLMATAAQVPALLVLLGTGLAVMCQSSSVAGALAVAGTGTGLITFEGACWIVYGANLGAAVNNAIFARAHSGEGAQIAWMQVVQKLAGFAAVLALMAVEMAIDRPLIVAALQALSASLSSQVAWLFLLYQIAGSALCTVLGKPIMTLLERAVPANELQELSKPAFLVNDALVEPSLAIDLVLREERRLLERLPTMLDGVRADAEGDIVPAATLRAAGATVARAMSFFLDAIIDSDPQRYDRERAVRLQHRTANLNALHEGLDEFVTACQAARQWPSSGSVADRMIESLHMLLGALVEATATENADDREFVLSMLGHRDEMMERIRQRVLREDPDMPAKAQEALFTATMLFERIIWLARRSALLLTPELAAGEQTAPVKSAI